jgi:pilus assembly protein Flp/PilA
MTKIDPLSPAAKHLACRFCADESGATAIEYAMIASGVGVAIAATVFLLGGGVKNLFTAVSAAFP